MKCTEPESKTHKHTEREKKNQNKASLYSHAVCVCLCLRVITLGCVARANQTNDRPSDQKDHFSFHAIRNNKLKRATFLFSLVSVVACSFV